MSVCLSVGAWKESCTFMKLQCILVILYIFHILCDIMLFGGNLHKSFNFGKDIPTTYQNSPKSVFYLFIWVLYNLVVCYSLDPVLVI